MLGWAIEQAASGTPGFRTKTIAIRRASFPHPPNAPRSTLIADQRRACAARPKGKYSRERMALAPIRAREFSLPRGAAVPPSSFINLTFTSQRSLLWYFLGLQESTVLPVSSPSPPRLPPPPLPIKKASPRLSGPASLQYEILAGKAAHYSALSTYMATNSTLSTYISTGTSLTLPRHTLITV